MNRTAERTRTTSEAARSIGFRAADAVTGRLGTISAQDQITLTLDELDGVNIHTALGIAQAVATRLGRQILLQTPRSEPMALCPPGKATNGS